ncbi:MAG: hypothetical protein ND866_30510 [Pyrinomonadaceae bacterium]|nr:hypothetical protein [Pyrinomonadaceae bacterium]
MRSTCDPPEFDEQDWSKFDLGRWHLDGLTLDSAAAAFAGLSTQLFTSEEWRQTFQTTLPELQRRALDSFKEHSNDLKQEQADVNKDFDERIAAADQRSVAFRESTEAATAPPVVEPSPNAFHLVVRVVSEKDARLGLPGIAVQILDPEDQKTALVESFTDNDGNTVITVPPELAKDRDKVDTTLQVLDPTNKPLATLPDAVCIRVGQTETRVVKVAEVATIAQHKNLALQIRVEREAHSRSLAGRSDVLKIELQTVLEVLDCQLRDNEAIIAELEKSEPSPRLPEPPQKSAPSPQAEPKEEPQAEPSEKKPRATSQKRRKKQ